MCERGFGAVRTFACKVVGQARSTQRRPAPARPPAEERQRARLREISRAHPRLGYRRVRIGLVKEGWKVNTRKGTASGEMRSCRSGPTPANVVRGTSTIDEVMASRPDEVWALDFQFDATADGRALKLLHYVDEFTREALVMRLGRTWNADRLIAELTGSSPPEALRATCAAITGPSSSPRRFRTGAGSLGRGTVFIEPGSPWQNPYVESFNARVRDELLNMTEFYTLHEAEVLVADFQMDYNWLRPHSSLQDLAPAMFAERWRMDHQPARLS